MAGWGSISSPRQPRTGERTWPQAAPREVQVEHREGFVLRKGDWILELTAREVVESLLPEVLKEGGRGTQWHGPGDKVMCGHRLDGRSQESSHLVDAVSPGPAADICGEELMSGCKVAG